MKRIITTIIVGLVMPACALSASAASAETCHTNTNSTFSTILDCEGNACSQAILTFDEAKQQY